jgi:TatA/E family protein of Tat protein translocase
MFGIGMPELLLILAIALIVIGPKKLPDLAKSLGRAMREFKRATSDFKDSLELDGDFKDVKSTFDDLKGNIKDPLNIHGQTEPKEADTHQKQRDLDSVYDKWKQDPDDKGDNPESDPSDVKPIDPAPEETKNQSPASDTQEPLKNG